MNLFDVTATYGWTLDAWAVFSNHYHFVAVSPKDARNLRTMIQRLHSEATRLLNERDGCEARHVWFQYWDTCLDFAASYYSRLNYVMNNPVKHGLAARAEDYSHCSARWFMLNAEKSYYRRVTSYRFDRVRVVDDF
jgi:putative transposase